MASEGDMVKAIFGCEMNEDCVYQLFFEEFSEAFVIFDVANDEFLDVNHKFAEMLGYTRDEIITSGIKPSELVNTADIAKFEQAAMKEKTGKLGLQNSEILQLKLNKKHGEIEDAEIAVKRVVLLNRIVSFGHLRFVTPFVSKLKELEAEIKQKSEFVEIAEIKANEIIQDNVRLTEISERILKTPIFSQYLEKCKNKEYLFQTSTTFLTSHAGMGFQSASLYMFDKNKSRLVLAAESSKESVTPRIIEMSDKSPITDLVLKKTSKLYLPDGTIAVPMMRRASAEGILLVRLDKVMVNMLFAEKQYRSTLTEILTNLANLIMYRLQNLELIEDLHQQTIIDQLTGAYNRGYFDNKLAREFSRSKRYLRDLSLILIDLDRFKEINDTYGHQQGDLLLQQFAGLLKSKTREVDAVCRLGGDEFAIIMPETVLDRTVRKAEELRGMVQEFAFSNMTNAMKPLYVTMSVGVKAVDAEFETWEELYRLADKALYKSKQDGRNLVSYF